MSKSKSMRSYLCTVTFTNARVKPRVLTVQTEGSRSDARRAARALITESMPGKDIAMVQVKYSSEKAPVEAPAGAKSVGTIEAARRPKARRAADPVKATFTAAANASGEKPGSKEWWLVYKAASAAHRAEVKAQAAPAEVPTPTLVAV